MEIVIEIPLPFSIPVEKNYQFLSKFESTVFVLRFEQYEKKTFIAENNPKIETCTKLFVYHFPKYPNLASLTEQEMLDLTFTDSLAHVNGFIDAARHRFGLVHIYNVTLWDLPQIIKIQMNGKEFPYFTDPELLRSDDFLIDGEGLQLISETRGAWDSYPEFYLMEKFHDNARSHFLKNQYIDAIIYLQTSFEIFIRTSLQLVLKKDGATEEKIEQSSTQPFRNIIEVHLGNTLKCDLNFHTSKEINKWYIDLYLIRNEIVHKGRFSLTEDEASNAYLSYIAARNFLNEKLIENGYISKDHKTDLSQFRKAYSPKFPIIDFT